MKFRFREFVFLVLIFFVVSFVYEISHSGLYDWEREPLKNDFGFKVNRLLLSTFGDVFALSVIFFFVSLINKNFNWIRKFRFVDYLIVIFIGVGFAIFWEIRAQIQEKWFYGPLMPTVFGLGVTSLIQIPICFFVSVWVFRKIV